MKEDMKNDWKIGDIEYIEYKSSNTNNYYKLKLESITNILKLRIQNRPKYYLYNLRFKKFLHINTESNVIYGCSCSGTLFTLDYANNRTRILLSSDSKYLTFMNNLKLTDKPIKESELYLLKNDKHYMFQTIYRTNNKKNKYGNHLGMDDEGIIDIRYDVEGNSKFILMNEHMYNNHIRGLMNSK
jgi:hypothetical protein